MRTKDLIEGLQILSLYYEDSEGYNNGAEHDIFYAYATDTPLSPDYVARMIELGWFQEDVVLGEDEYEFQVKHYDPEEGWAAFV